MGLRAAASSDSADFVVRLEILVHRSFFVEGLMPVVHLEDHRGEAVTGGGGRRGEHRGSY